MTIDTLNKFSVAMKGSGKIGILRPPEDSELTGDEAMILAAWLATLAPMAGATNKFEDVLEAVRAT
jgi:hypothetical protein